MIGSTAAGIVSVGNFPTTQPVSAAALPLPSGAAIAAKQPAIGTAGSPSVDVLTIQGVTNGQALPVTFPNGIALAPGSNLLAPSPTFVQTAALASSLTIKSAAGNLYSCYVTTGATPGYLMIFDTATLPASGTVTPKHALYCSAGATVSIDVNLATPQPFANGIIAAFSASTSPFTFTPSATAFIAGIAQ